jgi:hypothetical protein|tara:strand:- start:1342 stop:1893 length:552 start_codon:yes stop_codon:yes gene_type:complete
MTESQNTLLLNNLIQYYNDKEKLSKMLGIINGESYISLRIVDWFATNYAKKYYTVYSLDNNIRFKVYLDYKLKLKAYSKKRFDPFCRWDRITIPKDESSSIQTTIGQLNFFRWAMENKVIDYIEQNYKTIEGDMNARNSTSKNKASLPSSASQKKTRKKREELSNSAVKSIHKENVDVTVLFQ